MTILKLLGLAFLFIWLVCGLAVVAAWMEAKMESYRKIETKRK